MHLLTGFGRYLWRFFVGDSFQFWALAVATAAVALLAPSLRAWDGLLFFAAVMAVLWADVWRRASAKTRSW